MLLVLLCSSAHSADVFGDRGKLVSLALKGDSKSESKLMDASVERDNEARAYLSFKDYFTGMPEDAPEETKEAAAYLFAKWVSGSDDSLSGFWDARAHFGATIVYQSNGLYDMSRIPPAAVTLGEIEGAQYVLHDGNSANAYAPGLATTAALMKHGLPAIGPDGGDLIVCRLMGPAASPYFEMSRSLFASAIERFSLSGSDSDLCLPTQTGYWSERRGDFIDNHEKWSRPVGKFSLP